MLQIYRCVAELKFKFYALHNIKKCLSTQFQSLIIFEDNHLLLVSKPPSLLVQGDKSGDASLLNNAKQFLADRDRKPGDAFVGLVHRIDRPCSGVVVLAKTSKAASRLSKAFRDRTVVKNYMCVVNGELTGSAKLCHMLRKAETEDRVHIVGNFSNNATTTSSTQRSTQRTQSPIPNKNNSAPSVVARLVYTGVLSFPTGSSDTGMNGNDEVRSLGPTPTTNTLVRIELETGRKHQIRSQLAHIGHPIVGDAKYGAPQQFKQRDVALHAYSLSFPHPITKTMVTFAAMPPTLWERRFGREVTAAAARLIKDVAVDANPPDITSATS